MRDDGDNIRYLDSDILDDFGAKTQNYSKYAVASNGKRFANLIIDYIVYVILALAVGIIAAFIAGMIGYGEAFDDWTNSPNKLTDYLLDSMIYVGYYYAMEHFLKGQTIGKLLTKTRAVSRKGDIMTANELLIRSIIRLVPFDAFSFLGRPTKGWHDNWSKTYVVDETITLREKTALTQDPWG